MKTAILASLLLARPAAARAWPSYAPSTAPVTAAQVLERFEAFEKRMTSLSARFKQSVRSDETGVTQTIEGSVEYMKPELLRVEHQKPERQTIVSDGKFLWVWRHDTNQVIQSDLAEWKKSEPLANGLMDFGGYSNLLRSYDVSIEDVSPPGADGHRAVSLLLKPRQQGAEFTLRLTLSTRDYFPAEAELRAGQIRIRSHFEGLRLNPKLSAERFRFTAPPGADVFSNIKPPVKASP